MKERDKLERDEMVARMLQNDKEAVLKKKVGGIVENPASLKEEDRLSLIPELRKVSRQKYLEQREEQ